MSGLNEYTGVQTCANCTTQACSACKNCLLVVVSYDSTHHGGFLLVRLLTVFSTADAIVRKHTGMSINEHASHHCLRIPGNQAGSAMLGCLILLAMDLQ